MPQGPDERVEMVYTLLQPPTRLGGTQDGVMYGRLTSLGEVKMQTWIAASNEEREDIRRFEAAAARIDWTQPGPHEVRWEGVPHRNPRVTIPQGPRGDGPENEVFDQVSLVVEDDSVLLPTTEMINDYERESGFGLPESYRRFVLRFGPGTFTEAMELGIASPGYPKTIKWFDLAKLNRYWREAQPDMTDQLLERSFGPNVDRVRRLVIFCQGNDGDMYGWDPLDVTDPTAHEYGVYLLPRRGKPEVPRKGKSFVEFVEKCCFRRSKKQTYKAHHNAWVKKYDIVKAFLDETSWPLKPDQDVGDLAHNLLRDLTTRSKLTQAFKKWLKARFGKAPRDW